MKLLLTSDLHLGTDKSTAPVPGHVRTDTFRKICAIAADHDLFLIAGDLFDFDDEVGLPVMDMALEELAALRQKGVEVLYTPGESDIGLIKNQWPLPAESFTHVFLPESGPCYSITRGAETVTVYGIAPGTRDLRAIQRKETDGFHMALLHAVFCAEEAERLASLPYIGRDDIRTLKLDFYALGHNHSFRTFKSKNRVIGAYPGSPEAVGPNETGDRYVISITIENNEIIQIKRLSVNSITVERMDISCEDITSTRELSNIIQKGASERVALTVTLTGERAFPLDLQAIMENSGIYERLEVVDESTPNITLLSREFSKEDSLRGAFFERLGEMMEGGEIPDEIDRRLFARMLGSMTSPKEGRLEDWFCV